jgi:hydroxymethylpyrimidine pyrophosphatase-like HAD family hydrolase
MRSRSRLRRHDRAGRARRACRDRGGKEAQARGIVVILVTCRITADLRRVLPKPERFDAVVSENGAVLSFPNVPSRLLTHPPSQVLVYELAAPIHQRYEIQV